MFKLPDIDAQDLLLALGQSNFMWLIVPIFFVGIITDKYQEEFGTSVGNAISNGALIIFTGFSWLQLISSRTEFPADITLSQYLFAIIIVIYGFSIVASGFKTGNFAKKYGRIRVVTFMLMFFTMMIHVPLLYNFFSILLFIFLFPFYYAFITELIKILPSAGAGIEKKEQPFSDVKPDMQKWDSLRDRMKQYLE